MGNQMVVCNCIQMKEKGGSGGGLVAQNYQFYTEKKNVREYMERYLLQIILNLRQRFRHDVVKNQDLSERRNQLSQEEATLLAKAQQAEDTLEMMFLDCDLS